MHLRTHLFDVSRAKTSSNVSYTSLFHPRPRPRPRRNFRCPVLTITCSRLPVMTMSDPPLWALFFSFIVALLVFSHPAMIFAPPPPTSFETKFYTVQWKRMAYTHIKGDVGVASMPSGHCATPRPSRSEYLDRWKHVEDNSAFSRRSWVLFQSRRFHFGVVSC